MEFEIPQFVPYWDQREKNAVADVLDGDFLLEHKVTREFEKKFAEFVNARYCVTCTSGTVALYLALMTKKYDTIKIPSYQGLFAANALVMAGGKPEIVDVGPNGSVQEKVESLTVHANGRLGNVFEIEDCAQAINHHTHNKISCYSFASTKHITTLGQGGAICCDDRETFDLLTEIKDQGRTDRQNLKAPSDHFEKWGTNFKFTEAQAAFGLVQLERLAKRMERLDKIWQIYHDVLSKYVDFQYEIPRWYIDIFVDNPDQIVNNSKKYGFVTKRVHKPIHMQPLYFNSGCKTSEKIYNHGVFLPSTTNLTDSEVLKVADGIKKLL